MADDTTVLRQELANISGQLAEMQAVMMLWMSQQADTAMEQQKKTLPSPTKYAVWPYGSPRLKPDYHPEANNDPRSRSATRRQNRGL